MAPPTPEVDSPADLKATYASISGSKEFSHRLATKASLDKISEKDEPALFSKAKTAYLAELRSSVKQMQGEVNSFLTEKMEEDKKTAATNGQKGKDEVEEEKYGEEDVEED
jgi:Gon7 family